MSGKRKKYMKEISKNYIQNSQIQQEHKKNRSKRRTKEKANECR